MEKRPAARVGTFVVLAGVVLATIGNLSSNLVSATVPPAWANRALAALGLVALAECAVALLLGRMQSSLHAEDLRRRSRRRQGATVLLVALAELLAAALGAVSNVAAGKLPTKLAPFAVPLFVGVTAGVVGLAVLVFLTQSGPPVEETNRANFIKKLDSRYNSLRVDALRGAALIVLGLSHEPEAVVWPAFANGTPSGLQEPLAVRLEPPGTPISDVFDQAGGRLLILGAPGSGKTTLLLELALTLLGRARADWRVPVPVIFNLSTWAINQAPLGDWMAEDLVFRYQVPRQVARSWVANWAVLPLLDGFDEVTDAQRAACAREIDKYARIQPQFPVVVCSRTEAYRAQPIRLALRAAVVVQPLGDEQIAAYLMSGGERLEQLRQAIAADADLQDLVRTPLLLHLVTVTYGDLPRWSIPPITDRVAWRWRLFQEYVARMLERGRALEQGMPYLPEEVEVSLSWLAWQMRRHGYSEFYLEALEPDWLTDVQAQQHHLDVRIVSGAIVGGVSGLWTFFTFGALLLLTYELPIALIGALLGAVAVTLVFGGYIALHSGKRDYTVVVDRLGWSGRGMFKGLLWTLLTGLIGFTLYGLSSGLVHGLSSGLQTGLLAAIGLSAIAAPIFIISNGLSLSRVAARDRAYPGEGLRRSLRRGIVSGLVSALIGGLIAGVLLGPFGVIAMVPFSGLYFFLTSGGGVALRHALLRRRLREAGFLPHDVATFLAYAAAHVLVQPVGPGYRFIHGLLRDYFADRFDSGQYWDALHSVMAWRHGVR